MKKQIKNIIFTIMLATFSILTFSCKEMTDSMFPSGKPDKNETGKLEYNGKKPAEAISYVGSVNKTFEPVLENNRYATDYLNDYKGTGVTARVDIKLVEYNSLSKDIRNYIENLNSTGARHKTYNDLNCKKDMDYVEFTSYVDTRNENVIDYDLTFFNESIGTLSNLGKRLALSPDMEIDLVRLKYIKTGETAPKYKYPYSLNSKN